MKSLVVIAFSCNGATGAPCPWKDQPHQREVRDEVELWTGIEKLFIRVELDLYSSWTATQWHLEPCSSFKLPREAHVDGPVDKGLVQKNSWS